MIVHELFHSFRRLYRVEVFAVEIFDERYLLDLLFGELADYGGHLFEPRHERRPEPSFTRDYEKTAAVPDEQQGLQDAVRPDGRRHLFQRLLFESLTRLIGIAVYERDIYLLGGRAGVHHDIGFVVGKKCAEPFSAGPSFGCHKTPLFVVLTVFCGISRFSRDRLFRQSLLRPRL